MAASVIQSDSSPTAGLRGLKPGLAGPGLDGPEIPDLQAKRNDQIVVDRAKVIDILTVPADASFHQIDGLNRIGQRNRVEGFGLTHPMVDADNPPFHAAFRGSQVIASADCSHPGRPVTCKNRQAAGGLPLGIIFPLRDRCELPG